MKKKLCIIILIGVFFTFFIYQKYKNTDIYFISLGDGLASGMTPYNVDGYNYNDYIRDYLEKEHKLEEYISAFSRENQTVENLITKIEDNYKLEEKNITIQQAIAKSKLITIGIGIDELANNSLKQNIPTKEIEDYKKDMEKLVHLIRNFNDGKIYLLGLYKAYNMEEEELLDINDFLKNISKKYHLEYIDISEVTKNSDYFLQNESYYMNYKGHKDIATKILQTLNE